MPEGATEGEADESKPPPEKVAKVKTNRRKAEAPKASGKRKQE